jgi:hypothetical protein
LAVTGRDIKLSKCLGVRLEVGLNLQEEGLDRNSLMLPIENRLNVIKIECIK